jgi:hypothetical protein
MQTFAHLKVNHVQLIRKDLQYFQISDTYINSYVQP